MIQQMLVWLTSLGMPGLFLAMLLEGASLPFPGLIIVLSYGYILSPGYWQTALIALGMSFFYTIASVIPYVLGKKVEKYLSKKRFQKGLNKARALFNRYGVWSVALSRPFGIGNYISYVAGMSNVHMLKYLLLTFLGIYPWCYVMIKLGDYFKGNYGAVKSFFGSFGIYGYGIFAIILFVIMFWIYKKWKRSKIK